MKMIVSLQCLVQSIMLFNQLSAERISALDNVAIRSWLGVI